MASPSNSKKAPVPPQTQTRREDDWEDHSTPSDKDTIAT
ncbi:hypothetical protein PENSTE_c022G02910 [Penicillium steckii]|uniref:Uncharacterized protein n=1 Tax=Penicillium steckii TaxID=303698 RepID=A0A1V6SSL0_9EURO|nr:hypothetical protein PENSTE_c022G02910 [Penicillium steckii]